MSKSIATEAVASVTLGDTFKGSDANVVTSSDVLKILLSQPMFSYPTSRAEAVVKPIPPAISLGYSSHSNLCQIIFGFSYSKLRQYLTSKKSLKTERWGGIVDKQYAFIFAGVSDHVYILSTLYNWWVVSMGAPGRKKFEVFCLPADYTKLQPPAQIRGPKGEWVDGPDQTPRPSAVFLLEEFFESHRSCIDEQLTPSALECVMGLVKEYIIKYWGFNDSVDNLELSTNQTLDNEVQCLAVLKSLLGESTAVTVIPSCYLNSPTEKGQTSEFDALVVNNATQEVEIVIEMKVTFPPRDVAKKVCGLKAAIDIQNSGKPPFRSRDGQNDAYKLIRFPDSRHPRSIPLIYMADSVHPYPQLDDIAMLVASFTKSHPREALPFITMSGHPVVDLDHGQRKQPHLLFNLKAAADMLPSLQQRLAAIEFHIDPDRTFPFSGIINVSDFLGIGSLPSPAPRSSSHPSRGGPDLPLPDPLQSSTSTSS